MDASLPWQVGSSRQNASTTDIFIRKKAILSLREATTTVVVIVALIAFQSLIRFAKFVTKIAKKWGKMYVLKYYFLLYKKKYPVDFDDELKIGDVRYDDMT